jgi:hypothetical protein
MRQIWLGILWSLSPLSLVDMLMVHIKQMVKVSILSGTLSFLWPASFGLFPCLDFGPCPLFLFLSLGWVLSFF